jgi:sulfite exporter TauE/SafE
MSQEILVLTAAAASIGFFHTLLGPDHYLPFIVISRAGRWSTLKTAWVTFLCGAGHVGSSVVLGLVGIAFGLAVTRVEAVESVRGNLAAWLLIAFGLVYFVWGMRKALTSRTHEHWHAHEDGTYHIHKHAHVREHAHVHGGESPASLTPWVLFTIFVFGPCEPLIPLLMYPAAKASLLGLFWVVGVFGAVTLGTMLGVVLISSYGITFLPLGRLERYAHALAGFTICLSGLAIQLLGL